MHPSAASTMLDPVVNPRDLSRMSISELDALYISAPMRPRPEGIFRGRLLRWLPPACKPRNAPFVALELVAFQLLPWGIDFRSTLWWVGLRCLQGGLFEATEGRSRWRPTETFRMSYHRDRLPFFRRYLYDEVKPLSDDLCLGIGGINADEGVGDHFYYLLERR